MKSAINVNKEHILIMVIWGAFNYVSSPNSYIINSSIDNTKRKQGVYAGLSPINYDKINSQLIIPSNARVIYNGVEYGVCSSPVTLSVVNSNICVLIVSMATGTWAIRLNTDNITTDDIIVGILWNGNFVTDAKYFINGDYPSNGFGLVSGIKPINFDTILHTITIPKNSRVYKDNGYYNGSTVINDITLQLNGSASWIIVFNKVTNVYSAKSMPVHTLSESNDEIPIATYWAGKCFAFGIYTINGSSSGLFVESSHRLLVSPKMYFAKGTKLPIYKSGITNISNQIILNNIKTSVNYTLADGTPQFKYFDDDIDLDGEVLSSTFDIALKSDVINGFYSVSVSKQYVDPATKSKSTPKILMIGDSLTNRYLPKYTKDKLVSMGINPTMIGTMANLGGEKGEGRESWCFAHFIGRDTTLGMEAGVNHILPQPTGTFSNLNSNPFVRLATEDDYVAHPTWCFRNSVNGSFNELSYVEDIDKTGDFYIFDFSNYVNNHLGGVYPDIVTIALGTNDLTKATSLYNITGLQSCRLGLDIMLHQIKTASPTTKIAVIPSPAWGEGDLWETKVTEWIENAIKDVVTFALADVNIVPVWAHMDRSFVFPSSQTALNDLSNEVKNTVTDTLHFGTLGQKQYANVVASYVVNQL